MCEIMDKLKGRDMRSTMGKYISNDDMSKTAKGIGTILEENNNVVISADNQKKIKALIKEMNDN